MESKTKMSETLHMLFLSSSSPIPLETHPNTDIYPCIFTAIHIQGLLLKNREFFFGSAIWASKPGKWAILTFSFWNSVSENSRKALIFQEMISRDKWAPIQVVSVSKSKFKDFFILTILKSHPESGRVQHGSILVIDLQHNYQ